MTYTYTLTLDGYEIFEDGQLKISQKHRWDVPGWVPLTECSDAEKTTMAEAEIARLQGL